MRELSKAGTWAEEDGAFHGEITDDWTQGRTAFGGILVTAAVRAMQARAGPDRRLRSALTSFVAPVATGAVRAEVECLRQGKSLTFMEAHVRQGDRTCTRVSVCFGAGRETCLRIAGPGRPDAPPPEGIEPMPYLEGVTPAFTQHFDVRWTSPYPFTGAAEPRTQGWVRPRDEAPVDAASLLSLIDAWPPPEIVLADRPYPLSSVSWQVNLMADLPPAGVSADRFWFFDATTLVAEGGYTDSVGRLWGPNGTLVATSRQLVAEFFVDCREKETLR